MSATYPIGLSFYNNKVRQPFVPQKGVGINAVPVGITALTVRPFTNRDYTNNFATGFGLPHPIKHYRKGRAFNYPVSIDVNGTYVIEQANRGVRSTTKGTLVKQILDVPGAYSVIQNPPDETTNTELFEKDCSGCKGLEVVTTLKPNKSYLTNNPEITTTNPPLCCNEEKKALQRVIYASTNVKKNYYTTSSQYLQNRCKLYNQRAFNFLIPNVGLNTPAKPGSPLAETNAYLANCQCNADIQQATEYALTNKLLTSLLNNGLIVQSQIDEFYVSYPITIQGVYDFIQTLSEPTKNQANIVFQSFVNNPYWGIPATGPLSQKSCNVVVYKPNNYQYAQQGAVSSSTRLLKLNVNTITKNSATFKKNINFSPAISYNSTNNPFILKSKVETCNPSYSAKNGNPKTCFSLSPVSTNKIGYNAGRNGKKSFVQNITG